MNLRHTDGRCDDERPLCPAELLLLAELWRCNNYIHKPMRRSYEVNYESGRLVCAAGAERSLKV